MVRVASLAIKNIFELLHGNAKLKKCQGSEFLAFLNYKTFVLNWYTHLINIYWEKGHLTTELDNWAE